jgi:hypothetical protein
VCGEASRGLGRVASCVDLGLHLAAATRHMASAITS